MIDLDGPGVERSYRISAVEKAFAVVDAFCDEPYRLSLTEVCARTGLSSNQAFRVVQTLIASGYVRQIPDAKQYALGPAVFRLIAPMLNADELFQASREVVDSLFEATGEISSLSAFVNDESSVCVYVRLNEQPFAIPTAIGASSNDLHSGAVARTLLASRSDAEIEVLLDAREPLKTFNAHTLTDRAAIRDAIRETRANGYTVSNEEIVEGMYGIAAPVYDRRGGLVAAVSLVAPLARAGVAERERHLALLLDAAKRISTNLGYRAVVALG
jgi:DNA-binding IclR family transcriptional regulator